MEKFISITNKVGELEGKDRFNIIAIYATLKSHIKGDDLTVSRYSKAIANETGLSLDCIKRLVPTLKECGLILDITKSSEDAKGNLLEHKCNVFHFKDDMKGDYMMLSPKFLEYDLPSKIKGFLISLRSFCRNGSNVVTFGTKFKLKEMLKIGNTATLNSYLEEVEKTNIIKVIGNSIVFNNEYFYLYNPNSIKTDEQRLYEYIWKYCYENDVVPPMKHLNGRPTDRTLSLMATKLKGETVDIAKKIPNLPETVTLEYFLKALCGETRTINKYNFEFVL